MGLEMAFVTVEFLAALVDYNGATTGQTVSLYVGGDYDNHTYAFSEVFDYTVNYTKVSIVKCLFALISYKPI